ncbi:DUF1684 domain-containing protein [Aquirufa sp. OSTEICH-129A]
MKFNKWILILILGAIVLVFISLPKNETNKVTKSQEDSLALVKYRKEKDISMKEQEDSPIKDKESFIGLHYFPYESAWKIEFELEKNKQVEKISMPMSDGTKEEIIYIGDIKAQINGQNVRLKLYQHDNGDFFLPFKDKTAPTETYGGGRYLDIPLINLNGKILKADFNLAYFPFCAYNPEYACPVPPASNQLNFRIPAGEKN